MTNQQNQYKPATLFIRKNITDEIINYNIGGLKKHMDLFHLLSHRLEKPKKPQETPTSFLNKKNTIPENITLLRTALKKSKLESTNDLTTTTNTINNAETAYEHKMISTALSLLSQADRQIVRSIRRRKDNNKAGPPGQPRSKK